MILTDKFAFIHVPKCAGTSITNMLLDRHGIKGKGEPHACAQDIPEAMRDLVWIWGFMREPLEQEVSNWRYHSFSWDMENRTDWTFEDWCRWRWEEDQDWAPVPEGAAHYGWHLATRPQAGFFCDENGDCIANRIFRFDNLETCLWEASEMTGLDLTLSKDKSSHNEFVYHWSKKKDDWKRHLTDRAVELCHKHKALDFALWETPGPIRTTYNCPVSPDYGFSRVDGK